MKTIKYILLCISICGLTMLNAQDDKPEAFWNKGIVKDFKRIQEETEDYYKDRDKGQGSGYKQWKRWEYNQMHRLSPDRQITNYTARNSEAIQEFFRNNPKNNRVLNQWTQWGQNLYQTKTPFPNGVPGTGVLNCVAFDNDDPNIIYTGGPACGLWKTTNGGTSWFNVTDNSNYSIRGISSIVIDHQNDDVIYILTGDADGGDSPSLGVFKSTNGGISWAPTSLSWGLSDLKYGFKMAMSPVNQNLIIVATHNNGIYRTSDGGATWTNHESGTFYDVVWKPGSSSIVYASKASDVYKSSDGGVTWTNVANIPQSQRIQLAVTPQNSDIIYALGSGYRNWGGSTGHGFPGLILSTNNGTTWNFKSWTPAICSYLGDPVNYSTQATYNIDFAVKPTTFGIMVMGAINIFGSVNSGELWTQRTLWYDDNPLNQYVHPDIHGVEYNPLDNKLYIVSDGGISVSLDDGFTFEDITNDMQLNAFFDAAETPQNSNFMVGGLYHNGSRIFTGADTTMQLCGGDGAGCMIDPSNQNIMYYSSQQGEIWRQRNNIDTINIKPAPGKGPFVTPIALAPSSPNEIYVGWKNDSIFWSTNHGTSYGSVSVFPNDFLYNPTPGEVESISVAPDNNQVVYACTGETVFRSSNGGLSWTIIYYQGQDFTSVKALSANTAIITRGGYDANDKIYTYDASANATTNISNNLPNVPAWTSAYSSNNLNGEIYVGTDMGVYKSVFPYTTWSLFGTNIVNIPVMDLAIYPNASKIRAATFGRGIFESDITCSNSLNLTEANDPNFGAPVYQYNQAASYIFTSRKIQGSNGDATYKAGDYIILESGFLATEGNKVIVKTADCGED